MVWTRDQDGEWENTSKGAARRGGGNEEQRKAEKEVDRQCIGRHKRPRIGDERGDRPCQRSAEMEKFC